MNGGKQCYIRKTGLAQESTEEKWIAVQSKFAKFAKINNEHHLSWKVEYYFPKMTSGKMEQKRLAGESNHRILTGR